MKLRHGPLNFENIPDPLKVYSSFTICSTEHKKGTAERAVNRRIFLWFHIFDQGPTEVTKCSQRQKIRRIELGILALPRFRIENLESEIDVTQHSPFDELALISFGND